LWSEYYNREVGEGGIFEVQDEITPAIMDAFEDETAGP
jgi:TolB-like protein